MAVYIPEDPCEITSNFPSWLVKSKRLFPTTFSKQAYWILAEVSKVNHYKSKNYYFFDLVEKSDDVDEVVTCLEGTAWGFGASAIDDFVKATGQQFTKDIKVLMKVSVTYHATHGLKVNLLDIDYSYTIGNLLLQRQETLRRLVAKNSDCVRLENGLYISRNRELKPSPVIKRIALISSSMADGCKDCNDGLVNNEYKYLFDISLFHTNVQGKDVEYQMRERLLEIFKAERQFDVVLIVRGGASPVHLRTFDSYTLAQAVARFPIPIITGIGHLSNEFIVDIMAHKATKTPTAAAQTIVTHNKAFEDYVEHLQKVIRDKTCEIISRNKLELMQLNSNISLKSREVLGNNAQKIAQLSSSISANTKDILSKQNQQLTQLRSNIVTRTSDYINNCKQSLLPSMYTIANKSSQFTSKARSELVQRLFALNVYANNFINKKQYNLNYYIQLVKHNNPVNVLKRGYSLLYVKGKIVRDPNALITGSEMTTVLYNTEIHSIIKSKNTQTHEL